MKIIKGAAVELPYCYFEIYIVFGINMVKRVSQKVIGYLNQPKYIIKGGLYDRTYYNIAGFAFKRY